MTRCLHTVHFCLGYSWMFGTINTDGCQTYVELGGLLQYLLHYKSGVVGVLLFPGGIMVDIGKLNPHFIHKVIKIYKYKKYPT